jgi:pyridinium-3,5-bisthiocarboxylic acid mononucleotide nickel chelatase
MQHKILYIEALAGASGDMFLGALLDLGVPVEVLSTVWNSLGVDDYQVDIFQTEKSGLRALQCRVTTAEEKGPRNWKEYQALLNASALPQEIRKRSTELIRQIFEIEAAVHGTSIHKLHLHEMGGTDLLLDVTGTLAAIDYLNPSKVYCSPVNTGRGFVTFSHGRVPVPAPATTKLLEGIPIFQNEVEGELTTPTGALLIRSLSSGFGPLPPIQLEATGCGAGEKDIPGHPNVLRIFQGSTDSSGEDILLVETNIDDASPQVLAHFMEKAFEEGALDVFFTPIYMKKNRPAVRLTILMQTAQLEFLSRLLFAETSAIGFRYWKVDRKTLDRQWKTIHIGKQPVRIKESYFNGELMNSQPEYEDCKKVAAKLKKPVKQILAQAISVYLRFPH